MDITMQVSGPGLSAEQIDSLVREMAQTISQETSIINSLPSGNATPGAKGESLFLGTLILTFISSGAAVALFEVLKAYFSRDSRIHIAFKKPDGSEVNVSAQNMEPEKMQETIVKLKEILES